MSSTYKKHWYIYYRWIFWQYRWKTWMWDQSLSKIIFRIKNCINDSTLNQEHNDLWLYFNNGKRKNQRIWFTLKPNEQEG